MIDNPIFSELTALGLASEQSLVRICDSTRDKDIPVYRDRDSGVILLERIETSTSYYETDKPKDRAGGKFTTELKNGGVVTSPMLEDVERRFDQFKNLIKNRRFCDFGTGYGFFLDKALEVSGDVSGVELRHDCLEAIDERLGSRARVEKSIADFADPFELISLFHVLEHIPQQVATLRSIRERLADQGKIIVEVPHAEDFLIKEMDLSAFQKFTFWSEHLVLHTRQSLEAVLSAAGFHNIAITPFQRYGFTNHLHWLRQGKPGGHDVYRHLHDDELDTAYRAYLERNAMSDTLIAIAEM